MQSYSKFYLPLYPSHSAVPSHLGLPSQHCCREKRLYKKKPIRGRQLAFIPVTPWLCRCLDSYMYMCVWWALWLSECTAVPVSVILHASPLKLHSAYPLSSTSHSSSLLNLFGCPGYSGCNGTGSTMVAISAFTDYGPGLHYNCCFQLVPLCSCTVQLRGQKVSKTSFPHPSPHPPPLTGCHIMQS